MYFARKVRIASVQRQDASQPLRLRVEWAVGEGSTLPQEGEAGHWISLQAAITSQQLGEERFGEVAIPFSSYPPVRPPFVTGMGTVDAWAWSLTVQDAERIDAYRKRTQPRGPMSFNLTVSGIVQLGEQVQPVSDRTQITIEVSEWERYLGWIGYGVPPLVTELVSGMVSDSESWKQAEQRLATARRHLRAGETRASLEAILTELEALIEKPYQDEPWKAELVAAGLDNQKAQALARRFGGFGTYINKVGHHRDPEVTAPDGAVADQWEAELAVASAQLVLTEAFREGLKLRASPAKQAPVASKN